MQNKNRLSIIVMVLAGLALAAYGITTAFAGDGSAAANNPAAQTATSEQIRTISVSGSGMVTLVPDLAYVTVGVRTEDPDAGSAVEGNNLQTQAVIDAMLALGVAEEDVRTTNFSIYTFEDYVEPFVEGTTTRNSRYVVENSVSVTVRDLSVIGDLLSAAVDAGANNIWGIQFDVADKTEALATARSLAVDDAIARATELAGYAEVEVGEVISINMQSGGFPVPYQGLGGGAEMMAESTIPVPVTPGLLSVSVDIGMVFEIQ